MSDSVQKAVSIERRLTQPKEHLTWMLWLAYNLCYGFVTNLISNMEAAQSINRNTQVHLPTEYSEKFRNVVFSTAF
jgi:hypothetical protein